MDNKKDIDKLIDEALGSADDLQRATPLPYLLTRVNARLNNTRETVWEKAMRLIGKPAFAVPALAGLLLINATVIIFNRAEPFASVSEQLSQAPPDDFSFSGTTIYDIENTEP